MFAKVANRVRRRSAGLIALPTPPQEAEKKVDIAPELLRWADFSTPFPSVSLGGYSRFYETYTTAEPEPLRFCPLLSQQPSPSPSSDIPPKVPLFNTLRRRCLPLIREVSLESLTFNLKPMNLTITTNTTPPRSLKRRHRQLLRTPSVERSLALLSRCQTPSDTSITISNVSDNATPTPTDTPPSPSSIFSSDSRLSHKRSDSNYSEFPITPATSIEEEILSTELSDKLSSISSMPYIECGSESESVMSSITSPISPSSCCTVKIHPGHCHNDESDSESVVTRPLSSISYCSARSDFSEI